MSGAAIPALAGTSVAVPSNLAISTRGLQALSRIGVAEKVLDSAVRMPGRMIHGMEGGPVFQPYSADPSRAINSVSRAWAERRRDRRRCRRTEGVDPLRSALRRRRLRRWRSSLRGRAERRREQRSRRSGGGVRRRVLGGPIAAPEDRGLRLQPVVPLPRLQGTCDPAARRRRRGDGAQRAAHLAARGLHDDRPCPTAIDPSPARCSSPTSRVPPRSRPSTASTETTARWRS
jgi:hypothetical protein